MLTKMSSLTCFLPHIYHDRENMEINEFNLMLAKIAKVEKFCTCDLSLSNCHTCDNRTPKRRDIESKVCG